MKQNRKSNIAEKDFKFFSKMLTFLTIFCLLIFFSSFGFRDSRTSNWYNQYFPNLNGRPINDITFVDSLIGFAVTGDNTPYDTNFILKTTNGGDNWIKLDSVYGNISRVIFINSNTGFICGGWRTGIAGGFVSKTTNAGLNWNIIPSSIFANHFWDMFVLNNDTIWVVDSDQLEGGVYRTSNGGISWIQQYFLIGDNPVKIYMVNRNLGFASIGSSTRRTTNGGYNWIQINGESEFTQVTFVDSLTGWKSGYNQIKKTTNGGFNWFYQPLPVPNVGYIFYGITRFSVLNKDTVWGVGAIYEFPNQRDFGVLYRTTNGGNNWYFQIPDTGVINIYVYRHIYFYNKNKGWAYTSGRGIHTINGGDTTFLSFINNNNNIVDNNFILYQNYPNPFNPNTKINYELPKDGRVKLVIYDILGREIKTLVNELKQAGRYTIEFNGTQYASGVYFFRIQVDGGNSFTAVKKMVLIK